MTLDIIWYFVILLSLICYAMLDGFDLGVGMLHPFTQNDAERRTFLNAIGPVWDGNEVWLVVVSGALFAGFPGVFASLFSAFYIPVMILLFGLIFRAVSIEFRSKRDSKSWRYFWDYMFAAGSYVIAFGIGFVFGNIIEGIPLNQTHDYVGTFIHFLRPYPFMVGFTTTALFMMHGSIYLAMKTEGDLHDKMRHWTNRCIVLFIGIYCVLTLITTTQKPYMVARMWEIPWLFLIPIAAFVIILAIPFLARRRWDGWAFICSCLSIALLFSLFSVGTYPYMIRSTISPETNSLFITNSVSSQLTLKVLVTVVGIGVPLVLSYGYYVYRVFRGKVKLDKHSY